MTADQQFEAEIEDLAKRVIQLEQFDLQNIKRIKDLQEQLIKQNDVIIELQKEVSWLVEVVRIDAKSTLKV